MHTWKTPLVFPQASAYPTSSTNVHPGVHRVDSISLFYRGGNQVTERPGDSTRAILQVCKWALKRTQVSWLPVHHVLYHNLQIVSLRRRAHVAPLTLMWVRSYKLRHWALKVQSPRFLQVHKNLMIMTIEVSPLLGYVGQTQTCCPFWCESDMFLPLLFLCSPLHLLESQKSCYLKSKQDRQHYYLPGACWKYRLSGSIMKLSNQNLHFNRTPRWSVCTWRHK